MRKEIDMEPIRMTIIELLATEDAIADRLKDPMVSDRDRAALEAAHKKIQAARRIQHWKDKTDRR